MPKNKLGYKEGTWFGVPLDDGSYAIGIVARKHPGGKVLLGYFFGPKRTSLPDIDNLARLTRSNAIFVCMFGDLGLLKGSWHVIGEHNSFSRSDWPIPKFMRGEPGSFEIIEYSDDNLLTESRITRVVGEPSKDIPRDSLYGYEAVQITLGIMLDSGSARLSR